MTPCRNSSLSGPGLREQRRCAFLVTHSHSHGDHTAGDPQFKGKPGVTLVEPDADAVRGYFKFAKWPEGSATIDLGARQLIVLPAPGHQDESLAVYDAQTGWLLTGDSIYPGLLYIKDWNTYRSSIHRLAAFAKAQRVSAVMGTHIEMSRTPGKVYPRGSTFQPDETGLALTAEDLFALDQSLQRAGAEPTRNDDDEVRRHADRHLPTRAGQHSEVARRAVTRGCRERKEGETQHRSI